MAVPGFALPNRFRAVRDLCFSVVEGPSCARLPIYFLIQRRRSPSAHLVRRNGGTHCSQFHFGCLAVPFPVQIQIAVAVAPLLCLVPQRSFSVRTSAFTLAPLVARRGATPCSDFHFGCSAVPFPAPNRLFLRRIRPHQRPGGSSYFLSERQRSGSAPCAP